MQTRHDDSRTSSILAILYHWGRLTVGVIILLGLVLAVASFSGLGERVIQVGLATLTLIPAFGLAMVGGIWIRRRAADPVAWLAVLGAVFLLGAWIVL